MNEVDCLSDSCQGDWRKNRTIRIDASRHRACLPLTGKRGLITLFVPRTNGGRMTQSNGTIDAFAATPPLDVAAPASVRAQHGAILLRLLWSHREISRAELARRTGLSRSTVSTIVGGILATGIVRETRAGSSRGGRRPIMLGFDDDARTIVGLDIGASHIGGVLTNLRGQIVARREAPFPTREDPTGTMQAVIELGRALLKERSNVSPLGIGVGIPAPISPGTRRIFGPIMPAWVDVDVQAELSQAFELPVRANNDANLGALAEQWWGAGRGGQDLVFVKVATGIGAGLIIGGQIVDGANGVAGELGHLSIDPNGPPCICGVNGCLNVIVGTQPLLARTAARLPHFPDSQMHEPGVSLEALIDAVHNEDSLALEIIRFAGERLGEGLANLLNVLDPAIIVLGGDLTRAGKPLLNAVRKTVLRRTLVTSMGDAKVVTSQIDKQSIALGAATLILRAALDTQEIPLEASKESG